MAVLDLYSPDCRVALENSLSYLGRWHLEPDGKKLTYGLSYSFLKDESFAFNKFNQYTKQIK